MGIFGKCKGGGRRSAPRHAAPLIALVTTLKDTHSAVLLDVSTTGARLSGRGLPDIGGEMFVTVDRVIAFGEIVWSDGAQRGVVFDPPLSDADEALLRRKVAQAKGLAPDMKAALDDWTLGLAR